MCVTHPVANFGEGGSSQQPHVDFHPAMQNYRVQPWSAKVHGVG